MKKIISRLPLKTLSLFVVFFGGVLMFTSLFASPSVSADCGFTGGLHDYAGLKVISQVQPYGGGAPYTVNGNDVKITEYGYIDSSGTFHSGGASDGSGGNIVQLDPAGGNPSDDVTRRVTEATFSQIGDCGVSQVVLPGDGTNGSPSTDQGSSNWGLDCDNSKLGTDSNGNPLFQMFNVTGVGVPNGADPGGTWNVVHTSSTAGSASGIAAAANGTSNTVTITYTEPGPTWQLSGGGSVTNTTLTNTTDTVTFNLYATNNNGDPASYLYQVQKRYNNKADNYNGSWTSISFSGPGGASSGSESGIPDSGSGSIAPDITSPAYHFPSGAKDGDEYCEVIAFSNPNGPGSSNGSSPNSSWGYGPETVCVTYRPNGIVGCSGSSCPSNVACTEDEHNLDAHTNYRFTLFDSGGGSGYVSTTPVTVSGPNSAGDYTATSTTSNEGAWATLAGGQAAQASYSNSTDNTEPNTFVYPPPSGPDAYTVVEGWHHNSDGTWTYSYKVEGVTNCYSATCSIGIDGNLPDGSGNVQAGSGYTATASITNTGVQPLSGSINWAGNGNTGTNPSQGVSLGSGVPTPAGGSLDMDPGPTAPATQGSYSLSGTVYDGSYAVAGCPAATVNVYQHFTLVPSAGIDSSTSAENPTSVTYNTGVTQGPDPYPDPWTSPVAANTSSVLYYNPVGGGSTAVDNVPNSGSYGNTNYSNTYNGPDATHFQGQAGDQFCPVMNIDNATGWIGPGGELYQAGASTPANANCLIVSNRPYFKVYGEGNVSTGGDFTAANTGCSNTVGGTTQGELASWNNDTGTQPSSWSWDYGASTPLSAQALGNVTGFASAQNSYQSTYGPTQLTFANTVNGGPVDAYSPKLGGQFNPAGAQCLSDEQKPTAASIIPGPYPLDSGGTMTVSGDQSYFVNGDIYIGNNVTYGSGWTINNVPSLVIHATGNIYIAPGVTHLDGTYISYGNIYTCGTASYSPWPTSDLYHSCNNQLTVDGSFVAKQVKMLRTYGSLRDETPIPSGSTAGPNAYTSVPIDRFFCGGNLDPRGTSPLGEHFYQVESTPVIPSTPAECPASPEWNIGYAIPIQSAGTAPGTIALCSMRGLTAIDDDYLHPDSDPNCNDDRGTWSDAQTIGYVLPSGAATATQQPVYDFYDTRIGYHFFTIWCQELTVSIGPSASTCDSPVNVPDAYGIVYEGNPFDTYTAAGMGGVPTTMPTAASPPANPPCSNQGIASTGGTCAAEVFNFSPLEFLGKPAVAPPSGGALQFQSLTSLPPVL